MRDERLSRATGAGGFVFQLARTQGRARFALEATQSSGLPDANQTRASSVKLRIRAPGLRPATKFECRKLSQGASVREIGNERTSIADA
jgi:hypothetical protein